MVVLQQTWKVNTIWRWSQGFYSYEKVLTLKNSATKTVVAKSFSHTVICVWMYSFFFFCFVRIDILMGHLGIFLNQFYNNKQHVIFFEYIA